MLKDCVPDGKLSSNQLRPHSSEKRTVWYHEGMTRRESPVEGVVGEKRIY